MGDIVSNLVGHWPFDTNADDVSGNGNHGTLQGDAAITAGHIGAGAVTLDGTGDYVSIPHHSSIEVFSSAHTVSMWVKLQATGSYAGLWGKSASARVHRNSTGTNLYRLLSGLSTGNVATGGSYTVFDDTWRHVVMIWNGSAQIVYLNGSSVDSSATTGTPTGGGTSDLWIGKAPGGDPNATGLFDDVRIYSRALSSGDIADLYAYTGGSSSILPFTTRQIMNLRGYR